MLPLVAKPLPLAGEGVEEGGSLPEGAWNQAQRSRISDRAKPLPLAGEGVEEKQSFSGGGVDPSTPTPLQSIGSVNPTTPTIQLPSTTNSDTLSRPFFRRMWDGLNHRLDRKKFSYDTAFIRKPEQHLTLSVRGNLSGTTANYEGQSDGTAYRCELNAQMKTTISVAASYRGLSAALAVNPLKLAGIYKDFELNLNAYGNRMGVEAYLTSSRNFEGMSEYGDATRDIAKGKVSQRMLNVSAYYSFNNRRFSFPAVFTRSQIQRRSAGTLLLGATWQLGNISAHENLVFGGAQEADINISQIGLGAGYAYNLAAGKGWLIHFSAIPHIVLYNHLNLVVDDEKHKAPYRFPNLITIGRVAVIRNHGRCFYGFTAVSNSTMAGDAEQMRMVNVKWLTRICYGWRL